MFHMYYVRKLRKVYCNYVITYVEIVKNYVIYYVRFRAFDL